MIGLLAAIAATVCGLGLHVIYSIKVVEGSIFKRARYRAYARFWLILGLGGLPLIVINVMHVLGALGATS